jgi:hypothetical protein
MRNLTMKTKPPVLDRTGLDLAAAEAHAATVITRRQAVRIAAVFVTVCAIVLMILSVVVIGPAIGRVIEDRRKKRSYENVLALTISMIGVAQEAAEAKYPATAEGWQKLALGESRKERVDPWLAARRLGGIASKANLSLPHTSREATVYFFVPGGANTQDPNRVVIYEHPKLWKSGGGHVGFDSGHVKWFNKKEYEALLQSLTTPDGVPWRPHEGVPSPRADAGGE